MKNNNSKLWKVTAIILTLLITTLGSVYAYGRLNGRFEAVEKEIPKINDNENDIIGMKRDITHIKESVDLLIEHFVIVKK